MTNYGGVGISGPRIWLRVSGAQSDHSTRPWDERQSSFCKKQIPPKMFLVTRKNQLRLSGYRQLIRVLITLRKVEANGDDRQNREYRWAAVVCGLYLAATRKSCRGSAWPTESRVLLAS